MAIIRNERSKRTHEVAGATVEDAEAEEEIDYTWHPNEDEYVSPLTSEQWAELLSDEAFMESDAGRAVRCLREYGEPATFQQLSIRYRGTMGRYRRWLAEAAQTAGERYGVEAPQQDQFGMDEWWPLLYQIRNAGKPGAGIFEMSLRSEVEDAFLQLEEEERLAKRAENARQLKRIEQLERARMEERQRAAGSPRQRSGGATNVEAHGPTQAVTSDVHKDEGANDNAGQESKGSSRSVEETPKRRQEKSREERGAVSVPMSRIRTTETQGEAPAKLAEEASTRQLPALTSFMRLGEQSAAKGTRYVAKEAAAHEGAMDVATPLDYALRYADRLRYAFSLMRSSLPTLTLAELAREMGDESVEALQQLVNGQVIPTFAYLDTLRSRLYVGVDRLEAPDGHEESLPVFATLGEVCGSDGIGALLVGESLREIAYVVDDSNDRRTGVIIRFSDVRCALLTRDAVRGAAHRAESQNLEAFIRMVDELDGFARSQGALRTSRQVTAADWEDLVAGRVWPGAFLQ